MEGLPLPNILGVRQQKCEGMDSNELQSSSYLYSPKLGDTVRLTGGKTFHSSAFTPTNEKKSLTSLQALTPVTPLFPDFSSPHTDVERSPGQYWSPHSYSPETPGRKVAPERIMLAERLSDSSPFSLTPERQPLDFMSPERNRPLTESGRRGRPRADMVNNLIMEGTQSGNPIKCKICSRDFPREKSLQAHLRTHTGERPYLCDYPNCTRAFVQSGQLKTHQRLHAGEKPFKCPMDGCTNRYTHANRFCPDHPGVKPKRTSEISLQPIISASEDQEAVYAWLEKYRRDREEKTPGKMTSELAENEPCTPKRNTDEGLELKLKSKRGLASEMEEAFGQENIPSPPRMNINRSDILRSTLSAQQSFNQALQRAAEKSSEKNTNRVINLNSFKRESNSEFRSILELVKEPSSPAKSIRRSFEESSPMRGIRRTLGEITPSKNCKVDNTANLDLELPFNFDLAGSGERVLPLPSTPLPAEKCFSPIRNSPAIGSPAIKLKKRFQERFQEEKQQEKGVEELAQPISWQEEDAETTSKSIDLLATPLRKERNISPTFLVATALVELHESPTRVSSENQELPLNLTKKP